MRRVYGVDSSNISHVYLVNIILLNQVGLSQINVIKGGLPTGPDVLIGMDIITKGDFTVTNKGGVTIFSFRLPSLVHIDFVKEKNRNKRKTKSLASGKKRKRPKRR